MKLKYILLVPSLFFALSSFATDFPICLYSVNEATHLKLIKKAGFTCIQTYQTNPEKLKSFVKPANKLGLKVVFYPHEILGTPYEQQAQEWPILAWYLVDEPDVKRWDRTRVINAHQQTKLAFPNHPTALVIGQGKTRTPYYDIPDIMMVDWYPVPHLALTSFGDNVRYTKEEMTERNVADHPLWGVVQIFDWKNSKQRRPDNDRIGRFPTEEEIRFMSYHGILNGATGLFYYTFNHQGNILPISAPDYWKRVTAVTRELVKFKEIIEEGSVIEYLTTPDSLLAVKTWKYKGHLYSLLLNPTNMVVPLPAPFISSSFKALYGYKKTEQIPPHGVLLLKK